MADPHNPARYGETWPQHRIDAYQVVLDVLKPFVVFSGGWAWHFLSPPGHTEYKHAHDHKDVDLMVPTQQVATVMGSLQFLGFEKVRTRFDHLPSAEDFRRYEKVIGWFGCSNCSWEGDEAVEDETGPDFCPECEADATDKSFRLTIDFFVKDVPELLTPEGWRIVSPDELLTYYSTIHSSKSCWAVVAATANLANGAKPEDLVGDPSLGACFDLDCWFCTKCGWNGQFPLKEGKLTLCGGCKRYTPVNHGPPTFRPRPEQMDAMKKLLAAVKHGG